MRRIVMMLCGIVLLCLCAAGLAACGEEKPCEHVYADDYTCHDRVCTLCGETLQATTAHVFADDSAVVTAPTCTEPGYTTKTCVCGETEQSGDTPALGHAYVEDPEASTAPTCTEPGVTVKKCTRCQRTEEVIVAKLGHTAKANLDQVVAPTCTEQGYTLHTCERCSETFKDTYVAALGHEPSGEGTVAAPTCTEEGYTEYVCARCDETYREDVVDALGHNFVVEEENETATCETPAYEIRTCERQGCGVRETEVTALKLGHEYDDKQVCTTCKKHVSEVFALSVYQRDADPAKYYLVKADAKFGYLVYSEDYSDDAKSVQHVLNIDKATVDALLEAGYDTLRMRFGNPDGDLRAFNWILNETAWNAGNNFTENNFNETCVYEIDLAGLTLDDAGLNVMLIFASAPVAAGQPKYQPENFAVEVSYYRAVTAADPATQVRVTGAQTTYDGESKTWTVTGLPDPATAGNPPFDVWIAEEALAPFKERGETSVNVQIFFRDGQGLALDTPYMGAVNQAMDFYLPIPASGDLVIGNIYYGANPIGNTPDGFRMTINSVNAKDAGNRVKAGNATVSYDAETKTWTVAGGAYGAFNGATNNDLTLWIAKEALAALREAGSTEVRLILGSKAGESAVFGYEGKTGTGSLTITLALPAEGDLLVATVNVSPEAGKTIEGFTLRLCGEEHSFAESYTCGDRVCTICGLTVAGDGKHTPDDEFDCHERNCSACGAAIAATGTHTPDGEADCIERTCSVCGEKIPATGEHTYAESDSCEDRACEKCGTVDAGSGHEFTIEKSRKDATCTEEGELELECAKCHAPKKEPIAPLGHSYVETPVDATCEMPAHTVRGCERKCGLAEEITVTGAKLPHTYDGEQICTLCKKHVTDVFALSVSLQGSDPVKQYWIDRDETYGYLIHTADRDLRHILNIDRATIDLLIEMGYDTVRLRFANTDEQLRNFTWFVNGSDVFGGNNLTPNGFSTDCIFDVSLFAADGTLNAAVDASGLNVFVILAGANVNYTPVNFGVEISYFKSVTKEPETQIRVDANSTVTYDADTAAWTVSGLPEPGFLLWIAEEALQSYKEAGLTSVTVTITGKEGESFVVDIPGFGGDGASSATFDVKIPESGDLLIKPFYYGGAPTGFVLKIAAPTAA